MPAKTNKPARPKVRRYHVYAVILFIMGTLFPPLGVYLCNLVVDDAIVEWGADRH